MDRDLIEIVKSTLMTSGLDCGRDLAVRRRREETKTLGTMCLVTATNHLEDERGVDRAQIREILALTPAERVDRLVATVAVWTEMRTYTGIPTQDP